jgi:hypothetical protein
LSSIKQLFLGGSSGGYQIERSLRFNSADTAYLNRTFGSGDRKTWTFSCWIKKSVVVNDGNDVPLFSSVGASANYDSIRFNSDSTFRIYYSGGAAYATAISGSPVFRDVSAWYHFVVAQDTTQSTESLRLRVWINGVQQTLTGIPGLNYESGINNNVEHDIGKQYAQAQYFNGYMAEVNFIGGSAKTASDFGETDSATGVWKPKKFSGTYGTNGFYLNFSDNSNTTSTTLGKDSSGNGNNWTPSGFSVTAGAGNDSLVDTPTSYGTDTGVGGEVRGNYATLNPLNQNSTGVTLANGNLDITRSSTSNGQVWSTMGMTSGKWYAEVTIGDKTEFVPGIANGNMVAANRYLGQDANTWAYYYDGRKVNSGTYTSYGNTYTDGDTIGIAFDADAGALYFYKNGAVQNSGTAAFTGLTSGPYFFACSAESSTTANSWNFGQRAFANTAPSGYKAPCTQNLPPVTIGATNTTQANDYFNVVLWTGNDATRTITGYGFQPDFIWTKGVNVAAGHRLSDAVRGASGGTMLNLNTASTGAENTDTAITGFASDGFTMDGSNHPNVSPYRYVGWGWNAGGSNQTISVGQYATSPANVPSIASTVRANTTSGFSIVTFNIPASGTSDTIGHGLGVAPSMVILKPRTAGTSWGVYHSGLTSAAYYLTLQTTNAQTLSNNWWNSTAPTSSVFTIGSTWYGTTNAVAYCFAPVASYSSFGSYVGNGSTDGPFVYTGMRPRFIMIKSSSNSATDWYIWDAVRNTFNVAGDTLRPNLSNAETTGNNIDILSNGFKLREVSASYNQSSYTYIYAAFAENPFKYSLAR